MSSTDTLRRSVSPHESAHRGAIARLRMAARDLAHIAGQVREVSDRLTATLTRTPAPGSASRRPSPGLPAQRSLARALTNPSGLGFAFTGGAIGTVAARIGGLAGRGNLAIEVMVTSLRLRIAMLQVSHPELTGDPLLRRLIDAVSSDRDIEAVKALRDLFKERGAVKALSGIAPMFGEILAMKALLDENPVNDTVGWTMAAGHGAPMADPILGITTKTMTAMDRGTGAARAVDATAAEATTLHRHGSILGFLHNIDVVGNTGRILIQAITGPDQVLRYVIQAPGMQVGAPRNDSPQDAVGAFRNTLLNESPYTGALLKAVEHFAIPDGAQVALIGHSAGGAAIMNLAQDAAFCRRFAVTHAVAVGSPVDLKRPADPRTWVCSVTNQHDIVPTLDGQGAGSCFDLHPDWYVVDYTDTTHEFPACHHIRHYMTNLRDDLPYARQHIDEQLTPYRGTATRTQMYRIFDRPPAPAGFPFLTIPTHEVSVSTGPIELPLRCYDGGGLAAFFAADVAAAAQLLDGEWTAGLLTLGGRTLVGVCATDHRDTSLGAYRQVDVSLLVHDPWQPHRLLAWTEIMRRAARRRSGQLVVDRAVTAPQVDLASRELWGHPSFTATVDTSADGGRCDVTVATDDGPILRMVGQLGPAVPGVWPDTAHYSRLDTTILRSHGEALGRGSVHYLPRARLFVGSSAHPMAQHLRSLGLDGARPLFCLSAQAFRSRLHAPTPIVIS